MKSTAAPSLRFAVTFTAIGIVLFVLELSGPAQRMVVEPWTTLLARIAAGLITLFDPGVEASGRILRSTTSDFAISIEAGCNGMEAALVLIAAVLAFRAPWQAKLIGIGAGLLAIQAMNVLRVITLFYLGQASLQAFEWAHLYVWQTLIMLDVLIVWLLWLRWLRAPETIASA